MGQLVWAFASDIEADFAGPPSVNALESCPFCLRRVNMHVCTPLGPDRVLEDRPRIDWSIDRRSYYPPDRRSAQKECESFILTLTGASVVYRLILQIFLESVSRRLLSKAWLYVVHLYTYWRSKRR